MIEESAARPPGPAEVIVQVAGSALGVQPGAEVTGTVIAAGEAAADWVGRRVLVPRVLPCGECDRCRRGRSATCLARLARSGVRTQETVPARALCVLEPPLWPEGLELWQLAALADAASAPYGAMARAGVGPGELAVVLGGGPRGAFTVALLKAKGAHPVIVDGEPARSERAIGLGARFAADAALPAEALRTDIERQARALGIGSSGYKVFETTATAAGRARALELVPDGGTVVLLDGGDDGGPQAGAAWERLARGEVQVLGASACHPDLLPELCALVVRGELPVAPLVSAVRPEGLAAALAGRATASTLPILVF